MSDVAAAEQVVDSGERDQDEYAHEDDSLYPAWCRSFLWTHGIIIAVAGQWIAHDGCLRSRIGVILQYSVSICNTARLDS